MKNLNELVKKGLLFKCKSPATITSPAIASIFTGYPPEEHKYFQQLIFMLIGQKTLKIQNLKA
jgi:predicted AlkP superfamily phosphohydrolase/phosphomutase